MVLLYKVIGQSNVLPTRGRREQRRKINNPPVWVLEPMTFSITRGTFGFTRSPTGWEAIENLPVLHINHQSLLPRVQTTEHPIPVFFKIKINTKYKNIQRKIKN